MITKTILDAMPESTIFAAGLTTNSPEGVFMTDENLGRQMRWIAKRGIINDWAIYIYWEPEYISSEKIRNTTVAKLGDKIYNSAIIKKLVPCDDEAFKLYRY